jgi:hypothetical protein
VEVQWRPAAYHCVESHVASPIAARLAAAATVTVFVAVARVRVGPRAAAVTGVVGTLIAVVLVIAFA